MKIMRKTALNSEAKLMLKSIIGSLFGAGAYSMFVVPMRLYCGGFTGISQLIKLYMVQIFDIPNQAGVDLTGIILFCLNIPLFILTYRSLGKKFIIRTIFTVCLQSTFMTLIPSPKIPFFQDMLLGTAVGGVLSGVGAGVVLKAGSSGGGLDVIGMYCAKKFPNISVGKICFMINIMIYSFAVIKNGPEIAVYSIIFFAISAMIMDKVHYQNIKISAIIISKDEKMGQEITNRLQRGVTSWMGYGEYTGDKVYVNMVVLSKYEFLDLKKLLHLIDPHVFVVINTPETVLGNFEKRLEVK